MLVASDNPALYDLYNSPSRSPFSNLLGQGIRGMPAAPGSLQGPMQSLSQLQGQLSGLGIGGMNQASPFASSIRPDIRAMQQAQAELARGRSPVNQQLIRMQGQAITQGPASLGGRMAAPGTILPSGQVANQNPYVFPFNRDPRFSSQLVRPPTPRPFRPSRDFVPDPFAGTPLEGTGGIKIAPDDKGEPVPIPTPTPDIFPIPGPPPPPMTGGPTPTPDIFPIPESPPPPMTGGPTPPPISQPPRPFGGNRFGGIGAFFNQLAMMSPEQYSMGMDRFGQFRQQFGTSMGGGFGMFNQLAQMTPEQYSMGMDRFSQFNQQFGQMPPPRPQMPPPMTGGPRPNPYGEIPISRPFGGGFGGGFGGQRFQPPFQMMPFSGGFGGGFPQSSGQMTGGSLGPAINNMSMPAVQPPDPNQGALFRADAGAPMTNTAQSGSGGVF